MFEFSVIIPTFNRRENLYLVLCALDKTLMHYNERVEVVVMDDGSTDNSLEVMFELRENFALQYRWQPHQGFGVTSARNRGCTIARGKNYLFIDSDIMLTPESLAHLSNIVRANPGVIVAGRYDWMLPMHIRPYDVYQNWDEIIAGTLPSAQFGAEPKGIIGVDPRYLVSPEVFDERIIQSEYASYLYSGVLMFPKEVFWSLGGYDEKIKGHGGSDCEMGIRAQLAGHPAIFTSLVHGYHIYHDRDQAAHRASVRANVRYITSKHNLDKVGLRVWNVGDDCGISPKGAKYVCEGRGVE